MPKMARQLVDPCHQMPDPRDFGLGNVIVQRFVREYNVNSTQKQGMAIVIPTFYCTGEGKTPDFAGTGHVFPVNCFGVCPPTSSTSLSMADLGTWNANPFSTTGSALALDSFSDAGAYNLASLGTGSVIQRSVYGHMQLLSGCLTLEYTGAANHLSGQVAIIPGVDIMDILAPVGTTATSTGVPNIDQLFAMAPIVERLNPNGHEIRFDPSEHKVTATDGYLVRPSGTIDGLSGIGSAGTTLNPKAYIVCWRDLSDDNTNAKLRLRITKNTACFPQIHTEIGSVPATPTRDHTSETLQWLYRNMPTWNTAHAAANAAGTFAQAMFTATMPRQGALRYEL